MIKTTKIVIQTTTDDLIINKTPNKITKNSPQNNSETFSQREEKSVELSKERYI